jgi:type III secretory pathway lipoprotein EscJ
MVITKKIKRIIREGVPEINPENENFLLNTSDKKIINIPENNPDNPDNAHEARTRKVAQRFWSPALA